MKKIVIKCPRCGKEEVVEKAYYREVVSCEHCHFKHQITKKTRNIIKVAGYFTSLAIMFLICAIVTLFTGTLENKWLLAIVIVSALVIVPTSNYIAKPLVYLLGLWKYEPLTEEKVKKNKK